MQKKNTAIKLATRLSGYAAMATSLLVMADVNGQIVYTEVDPDFLGDSFGSQFDIDFNNDDINDITIEYGPFQYWIGAHPASENSAVGYSSFSSWNYANPLNPGDLIDSNRYFIDNNAVMFSAFEYGGSITYGWWENEVNGYLGVKFKINEEDHYGWVRMDVGENENGFFILKDFAYEATAGLGVTAGDDSFIGDLPVPLTQDIIVNLDENGMASVSPEDVDIGSTDTGGDVTLVLSKTEFTTEDLGDNLVFLRVIDSDNNSVIRSITVTIEEFLDVNDIQNYGISLSPNPADNVIMINNPDQIKISSLRLIDLQGRILLVKDGLEETISSLQLDTIDSGNYFLEFTIDNKTMTEQIIKR